jgi:penicillin-binding protein 1C
MEPWLPEALRRSELLPKIAEACAKTSLPSEGLTLTGIIDGNRYLKAGPDSPPPRLALSALGGQGNRYWYLNGRYRYRTQPRETLYLDLKQTGPLQITVIDQAGNLDQGAVNLE